MTLKDWQSNGWLQGHRTSPSEVRQLFEAAKSDLENAATKGLSAAWSFNIAYNAALHLCNLALAAEGYRATRDNKHYRTIAALELILGDQASDLVAFLDHCRTMRHDITYEGVDRVSRAEADELIKAVRELQALLVGWLKRTHPDLK